MSRSLHSVLLACAVALVAARPSTASASSHVDADVELAVPVEEPFHLSLRSRTWNGDPHSMPAGRVVLEAADRQPIWEVASVTAATASADGSTVALLTSEYQILVSRLPEAPRLLEGGLYLVPRLSADGSRLVAQRLGSGVHILDKTRATQGIALIDTASGEHRLILEGSDLYLPSFADEDRIFFGSGGPEQFASLHLLDTRDMTVARVTNRGPGSRQAFPDDVPRLLDAEVVFESEGRVVTVAVPTPRDFMPLRRFDAPELAGEASDVSGTSPDFGNVRLRRPGTQSNNPVVYFYFDLTPGGGTKDYACNSWTYNGHQGTDFNQSFGNDVVAPASGKVLLRYDGCGNSNSPGCGYGLGNFAALQHSDLSVSVEAHGRSGTVVPLGSSPACGSKIMESASSGNSNAYHIHHESWPGFETWRSLKGRYDPYQGSCDSNDPSKWSSQGPYKGLPGTTCTH